MNLRSALLLWLAFALFLAAPAFAQEPKPRVDPKLLKAYEFELVQERKLADDLTAIAKELKDNDDSVLVATVKLSAARKRADEALGRRRPLREPPPEIAEVLKEQREKLNKQAEAYFEKLGESPRYRRLIEKMLEFSPRELDPPVAVPATQEYRIDVVPTDPAAKPLVLPADLLGHEDDVTALAFSGDGQWLASAASGENEPNGRSIRIWNLPTGHVALILSLPPPAEGDRSRINGLRLTHDGGLLLSCTKDGSAHVWDLKNRRPVVTFDVGIGGFNLKLDLLPLIAISGDGKTAAVGDDDDLVVFELATGKLLDSRFDSPPVEVASLALSTDGKLLARNVVARERHSLEVLHVGTRRVDRIGGPEQLFFGLRFSPDSRRLSWVNRSNEAVKHNLQPNDLPGVRGAADGSFALEAPTGPALGRFSSRTVDFSADGELLVVQCGFDLTLYDLTAEKKIRSFPHRLGAPLCHRLALSPNGKLIARGSDRGLVRLMTADKGLDGAVPVEIGGYLPNPEKLSLRGHTDYVSSLDYFPDGLRLVSSSRDGTVRVWNTATGTLVKTHAINTPCVRTLRDGKTILVHVASKEFGSESKIALFDLETQLFTTTFGEGRSVVPLEEDLRAIAQIPDGRFVGSSCQGLSFWKADGTFEKLIKFDPELGPGPYNSDPRPLLVSADGRRIFTDDVLLWDVTNAKQLLRTEKHFLRSGGLRCVAMSRDGKLVAGHEHRKGQSWKLRIWNAETGQSLVEQEFDGYLTPQSMSFSPNNKVLTFGSIAPGHTFVDTTTGDILAHQKSDGVLHESLFSPDGKQIAETAGKNVILRATSALDAKVKKALAEPASK